MGATCLSDGRGLLRATTHDPNVDSESADDLLEEDHPAKERFDEGDRQIRSREREWDSGKSGSTADIDDLLRITEMGCSRCAVQHVPVPQPWSLTWTHQSSFEPGSGQELNVPGGER